MNEPTILEGRNIRDEFTTALADRSHFEARRAARVLLAEDGGTRTVKFLAKHLKTALAADDSLPRVKIALLSSYSADFIEDALCVASYANGLNAEVYLPGFNQFRQEILSPQSGLYAFQPDVVILSLLGEDLCRPLYDTLPADGAELAAQTRDELTGLFDHFRSQSTAPVLVQNFLPPRHPTLGIGDINTATGQRRGVQALNAALLDVCGERSNVYVVDYEALVREHGAGHWHDERMRYFAQLPLDKRMFLPLAREYAKYLRVLKGGAKKCVVVDCDNTLWGGIVGEDGLDGIKLDTVYPGNAFIAFQKALAALHDRGILLAIASKNNPEDVDEVFTAHPHMVLKKDHFAAIEVHWNPKSESLKAIAETLNIGLEHMVFIDDNPVECAEVERALPQVEVLHFPHQPERFADVLFADGLFDQLSYSAEDRKRGELYKQRAQAEAMRADVTNLEDFYRDLDMEIVIEPVTPQSLPRTAQLTQKTNQFNVTTRRYTESAIAERLRDDRWHVETITVRDRFGDNGIVGVIMSEEQDGVLDIDTFLLSCRVIGRTVETAMLAHLCDIARDKGCGTVHGRVIPTAKNKPARSVFADNGFTQAAGTAASDGAVDWELSVNEKRVEWPEWFSVGGAGANKRP